MFSAFHRTKLITFLTRRYINISAVRSMKGPSTYASSNKIAKKKVSVCIDEFADNLINMRGQCMDIGCGPGDLTKNILLPALNSNAVLIGTDISENMIEYAQRTYGVKKRLEFEVLDIQTKKLPQKYVSEFDHVFSIYALQLCNDIRQAFENIYHMLRPDGTMLVVFIASHDICKILENMIQDDRFASYIPNTYKCIFPYQNSVNPRKELKELLQKLGFTVTHCSLRDVYYIEENLDQYLSSILSIFEFLDKMPHNLKEEFQKDFVRLYGEKRIYKDKNQKTHVLQLHNVLIAFAEKRVL